MKKNACRILVILIVIVIIGVTKTYAAIGKNLDKRILREVGLADGMETEEEEEMVANILKILQDDFQYKGETVNKEMKMLTQFSIEEANEEENKYTIRIRSRRKYR